MMWERALRLATVVVIVVSVFGLYGQMFGAGGYWTWFWIKAIVFAVVCTKLMYGGKKGE